MRSLVVLFSLALVTVTATPAISQEQPQGTTEALKKFL